MPIDPDQLTGAAIAIVTALVILLGIIYTARDTTSLSDPDATLFDQIEEYRNDFS